ncbi:hypothetical protein AVEN_232121-1 [Araneus ventricosus]|uniref:Uncharacterized protein n=1 Tax=Araneus ventricosus TaxID=182803 RepID=A0A4Y2UBB9_ARAVE|nr:hypothetical protein AVEN_232121-1 [Araneus ventricosus]
MKQPPDATSSSDSEPDFSPSPRPQTYGLRPSRGSIPRTLISPPTTFVRQTLLMNNVHQKIQHGIGLILKYEGLEEFLGLMLSYSDPTSSFSYVLWLHLVETDRYKLIDYQ